MYAPFACANVRVYRFQPRYKLIRKKLNEKDCIHEFQSLLLNIVYSSHNSDEQLGYFNTLVFERLKRLFRGQESLDPQLFGCKAIRRFLQQQCSIARKECHRSGTQESQVKFHEIKRHCLRNRKRCGVLYIVFLRLSQLPLRFDPDKLSDFFASTPERLLSNAIDTSQCQAEFG